ncbi:CAP domain-containing protein [Nocardioides sp.]|uniref:CAP domain-containing protein n=1 Tax=Nocardioides sp. TaxID=35761 RepID=UPI002C572BAE|nr:CAP domain-containing protein [Nocardioides sp.]HXH80249.1 CAP domain-containing protein [Nocardioides sp.]
MTVALAATLSALSATLQAPSAQASADLDYEAQAVATTNLHRTLNGLAPLRPSACLGRFAQRHAQRMADQRRMFHRDLAPILRRCDLSSVGENVAYGYSDSRAVVSDGWMLSAGHRKNILEARFRLVAVRAVQSGNGRWYTAQVLGAR